MANRCEWEWAAYAWDGSIDDGQRVSRLQSAATGPMLVCARIMDRNTINSQMRKHPVSGKFCVEKCLFLMSGVRMRRLVGDRGKVNQVSWCLLPGSLKAGVKLLLLQQLRLIVLVKRFCLKRSQRLGFYSNIWTVSYKISCWYLWCQPIIIFIINNKYNK